jgi:glycosyltransferase involved in cell wall biosynthesis
MAPSFSMVYGTNIWNHYQGSVASELLKLLGPEHFRMALFEALHEERLKLGWSEERNAGSWVIGPPSNEQEKNKLYQSCFNADVMVFGACPMEVLKARVASKKVTLVASERMLKKRLHRFRMLNPRYAKGIMRYRALVNHSYVHALSIGYHAPMDLRTIGAFGDRIWKWGYFVDVSPKPPGPVPDRPLKILWVGRMLKWKKLDILLQAMARIKNTLRFGECIIVGDGPEKCNLQHLAHRLGFNSDRVRFHAPVPPIKVREMMRDSDVYVLPSNREEGWGVVAGEAMAEGCVLVANEEAGAARELVLEGKTGFLFKGDNIDQLASLLEHLANNYALRIQVRKQAWEMMDSLWRPNIAARRLVAFCEAQMKQSLIPMYRNGPFCQV